MVNFSRLELFKYVLGNYLEMQMFEETQNISFKIHSIITCN